MNWGIKVLQTSALPLGYGAVFSCGRYYSKGKRICQGENCFFYYFLLLFENKEERDPLFKKGLCFFRLFWGR